MHYLEVDGYIFIKCRKKTVPNNIKKYIINDGGTCRFRVKVDKNWILQRELFDRTVLRGSYSDNNQTANEIHSQRNKSRPLLYLQPRELLQEVARPRVSGPRLADQTHARQAHVAHFRNPRTLHTQPSHSLGRSGIP